MNKTTPDKTNSTKPDMGQTQAQLIFSSYVKIFQEITIF